MFTHSSIYPFIYLPINQFTHVFTIHPLRNPCKPVSIHLFTPSSIQSFIHSSIHPFIYLPIHLFTHSSIHPFIYSPIHLFTHSSIHPFIYSPIHLFTHSSIHTFIYSHIHLFTHSNIHPFSYLPIQLFTHSSITYSPIQPFIYSSIHLFTHSSIYISIHSPIHLFTHSSIHPFIYSHIHLFIRSSIHTFIYAPIHLFTHSSIYPFTSSPIHPFLSIFSLIYLQTNPYQSTFRPIQSSFTHPSIHPLSLFLSSVCQIRVQGYSNKDTVKVGHIEVNRKRIHSWSNTSGLYVAQLHPGSCKVKDVFRFECRLSAQPFLAFLAVQKTGTTLVAVSAGDSIKDLTHAAPFMQDR